jgi:hypothetical protein
MATQLWRGSWSGGGAGSGVGVMPLVHGEPPECYVDGMQKLMNQKPAEPKE